MKKLLLFGSFLLFAWSSSAQQLEEFMDDDTDKYGFMNEDTEEIIVPAKYDEVGSWEENDTRMLVGIYADEDEDEMLYGYINEKGQEIIPLIYTDAYDFSEGLALVYQEDDFGFIDVNGNMVLAKLNEKFKRVNNAFSNGLLVVYDNNNQGGFIDTKGKTVIKCQFKHHVGNFNDERAFVEDTNKKYGYIDQKGKVVISYEYDYAGNFNPEVGLACVSKDGKYGFIDKKGKVVIPLIYKENAQFRNGVAHVKDDKGKYKINTKGEVIK